MAQGPRLLELDDKLGFGKYAGCTVRQVGQSDKKYLEWAVNSGIIEILPARRGFPQEQQQSAVQEKRRTDFYLRNQRELEDYLDKVAPLRLSAVEWESYLREVAESDKEYWS